MAEIKADGRVSTTKRKTSNKKITVPDVSIGVPESPKPAARYDQQSQKCYVDYRTVDKHIFIDEAYNGSGGFSGTSDKSYIIPNKVENFYLTRIKMSIYHNFLKKFIRSQVDPIFKLPLNTHVYTESSTELQDSMFSTWVKNVNGSGMSKQDFVKTCLITSKLHDVSFVGMDKIAGAVLPYVYKKSPSDIQSYETDASGALVWIAFWEKEEIGIDNKKMYKRRYVGVDYFKMQKSENGREWVDEVSVPNTLGFLPIYCMWSSRSDDPTDYRVEYPSTYDLAEYGAYIYDKGSKLDLIIDKQCHSQLVINGDLPAAGIAGSADNCLVIPPSEKSVFQPTYISPDPTLPAVHQQRIDSVINLMFSLMKDLGVDASAEQITAPESGIARAYRFIASNDTLKKGVSMLIALDGWLCETFKAFTGDDGKWTAETVYPKDFQPVVSASAMELQTVIEFYESADLRLNAAAVHKQLLNTLNPQASKENLQPLIEEIENHYKQVD